jgi:hypothetical protein
MFVGYSTLNIEVFFIRKTKTCESVEPPGTILSECTGSNARRWTITLDAQMEPAMLAACQLLINIAGQLTSHDDSQQSRDGTAKADYLKEHIGNFRVQLR